MSALAAFLLTRATEDEEEARAAAGWQRDGRTRASGHWTRSGIASLEDDEGRSVIYSDADQLTPDVADHVARHDPARVLAECAARRAIVEAMIESDSDHSVYYEQGMGLHVALCHLASVYADHPDYDPAWAVS